MIFTESQREAFLARLQPVGECLVWPRSPKRKGYSSYAIRLTGPVGPYRTSIGVHQVAWMLGHGRIPRGMKVLHRCDNPPCCRLEHLFLGTQLDNMRDMAAKGRANPRLGEASRSAKLAEADVLEIRASSESQKALGERFGVSPSTIYGIRHRKTWAHLA